MSGWVPSGISTSLVDTLDTKRCAIAAAAGISLDATERIAFQRDLFSTAGGRASMLGDVLAHRRTEIDTINGAALRHADPARHACISRVPTRKKWRSFSPALSSCRFPGESASASIV